MTDVKTSDTYEATFYIISGAKLTSMEITGIQKNKWKKTGYTKAIRFNLTNVKDKCIKQWKEYRAIVNIRQFEDARKKLKLKMHRFERGEI